MAIKYGTSHFVDFEAAVDYYAAQGENRNTVQRKIKEHSIFIGKPTLKTGQKLILNKEEGRYFIECPE